MLRTWLPRLARILTACLAAGGTATTVLLLVDRLRTQVLVVLAAAMLLNGLFHLLRALVHWVDDEYWRRPRARALVRLDLCFAAAWIGLAVSLAGLGLLVAVPVVVPLAGAGAAFALTVGGFLIAAKTARVEKRLRIPGGSAFVAAWPAVQELQGLLGAAERFFWARRLRGVWGRKVPKGEVSTYLICTLATTLAIGCAFTAVALGEAANQLIPHAQHSPSTESPSVARGGAGDQPLEPEVVPRPTVVQTPPPTYAELCPELPDPQDVGEGLGDLFESDGGAAAGCGERAQRVDESLAIAVGRCGDEVRSLAVAGDGHVALLYGAAAAFALEAGEMGTLRYAEVAAPSSGELAIVATAQGTSVFAGAVPAIEVAGAERCQEVRLNPPAPRLAPPLAQLWLDLVREVSWVWPRTEAVPGGEEYAFAAGASQEPIAGAACTSDVVCSLTGPGGRRGFEGIATVSVADFDPYLP